MVGVPRSTSCRECLQRRVKCDQTRPGCRRCIARGISCPGYHRTLKFYNQTTKEDDFTDARTFDRLKERKRSSAIIAQSSRSLMILPRPSMDESIAPNLAAKALDVQTKEVFWYVVQGTFPMTFGTFAERLDPNWVEFIRNHQAAQTAPIEKGIRTLNTWFLGFKNGDQEKINASRYYYGEGLRFLAGMVANPRTRTSDLTLATAILLGIFEMLDGVSPNSWLIHSNGIGQLFKLRGARAHRDGFGRTLFVTYRSFLLADAFARKIPSFLEEPEWRAMIQESIAREERAGKGSWIGKVTEQAFNEVCLTPGLLAQTTALITGESVPGVSRDGLLSRVQHSRSSLRHLQRQLASVSGLEVKLKAIEKLSHVNGPIPLELIHGMAKFSLHGISSGLALLDQLVVLLEADKKRVPDGQEGRVLANVWARSTSSTPDPGLNPLDAPEPTLEVNFEGEERPLDFLDQIAMTMGTLALKDNS